MKENKARENPWKRKLWWYEVTMICPYITLSGESMDVTRKLGFVSYHLIKYFHGEKRIIEMGTKI